MPPPRSSFLAILLLLAVHLTPAAAAKHRPTSTSPAARSSRSSLRNSWAGNLTLLGSASLLPGASAVALTAPSRDGIGAGRALFSEPVRLLLPSVAPASFSTRFTFRITPAPTYGDGLAFLLTSSSTFLGASNGFLGLFSSSASDDDEADLRGVSTVAVEFDTHRDVALRDTDGNHVALDAGSIFSVASASPGVDLRAGVPITAWVDYRAPRRHLSVWLSYSSSRRPDRPALSVDVDLSGLLRTQMYAGFSASNGHGTALHVVERWTFRTYGFNKSSQASPPLESPVPPTGEQLPLAGNYPLHRHRSPLYKVLGGVLGGVVLLILVVGGSVACLYRPVRRRKQEPTVPSEDKPCGTIPMDVVRTATKNFNSGNVIGIGGSGAIVYEGVLPEGSRVAVKRFQVDLRCTKALSNELTAMLSCCDHPNLVKLSGWCRGKDDFVLVYDFMPNGNLDGALHRLGGATLPWEARFRAVLGIASALEFLHDKCNCRILHRDVKSSNVLLDAEFNARLGDFGLARLLSIDQLPLTTQPAGTLGYLAPEYVHSGVATEFSDVYSFGVLALEVATGWRPIQMGVSVVDWVWGLWGRRRLIDAADQRLRGRFVTEEMRRVLLVGLSCVHPDCRNRHGMRRVVRMLDGSDPLSLVPDKKPTVMLQTQRNQASSMGTVNTVFYSCR